MTLNCMSHNLYLACYTIARYAWSGPDDTVSTVTRDDKEVAEAIKNLRTHLGESQQTFSNRLGVVVRTVARWELEVPPKGEILLRLFDLSQETGRDDLAQIFANALNTLPPKVLFESARSTIWPVLLKNIKVWGEIDCTLQGLERVAADAKSKPADYRSHIDALRKSVDQIRKQTVQLTALLGIDPEELLHRGSATESSSKLNKK